MSEPQPHPSQPSKVSVTHAEYGALVWHLCTKFTLEFTKKFAFQPADKEALNARVIEIIDLHLWSCLKAIGLDDTAALDEIHRLYLDSVAKDLAPDAPLARLKTELLARYEEYFKAWKDGDGEPLQPTFAAAAMEHVFGAPGEKGFDTFKKVEFMTWVLGTMSAVLKMRGELEIRES